MRQILTFARFFKPKIHIVRLGQFTGLFLSISLCETRNWLVSTIYNNDDQQNYQQDIKSINQKELLTYLSSPQYYQNSIVIFNQDNKNLILSRINVRKGIKILQTLPVDNDEELIKQYDCVCTNQKGQIRLFKLHHYHDLIKIQNFYDGVHDLDVQQIIKLIDEQNSKIILTYIPDQKEQNIQRQKIYKTHQSPDFDSFKKNNDPNFENLEQNFEEIRFESLDTDCLFVIIRSEQSAKQLGLSKSDIGQIYSLKNTNIYQGSESGLILNQKEYYFTKIEPDPNLEDIQYFYKTDINELNILKKILIDVQQQNLEQVIISQNELPQKDIEQIPTQRLDINKILSRICLRSLPYVSYVDNEQQLINNLLISKQMGATHFLIYKVNNESNQQKMIKKLVNLKKSLNPQSQEKLVIFMSDNEDLFQKYFQLIGDNINDQVRLIKIKEKREIGCIIIQEVVEYGCRQKETENEYKIIFKISRVPDFLKEFQLISDKAVRFRYFGKPTFNRIKYFLYDTCPELHIQNIKSPKEQTYFMYEPYLETEFQNSTYSLDSKILTANNFIQNVIARNDPVLVYFYKSNCVQCQIMNNTYEKTAKVIKEISIEAQKLFNSKSKIEQYEDNILNKYRINNPQKFINLSITKYNILNEIQSFPSPSAAPLLFLFRNKQQPLQADLIKQRISPADEDKFISYILRLIDNS